MLRIRIISAVVGILLLIVTIKIGGPLLLTASLLASLLGYNEYVKALGKKGHVLFFLPGSILMILVFFYAYTSPVNLFLKSGIMLIYGIIIIVFVFYLFNFGKYSILDAVLTYFGMIYISLPFCMMIIFRKYELGELALWSALIMSWACDTAAYFTGILLGKTKLCPKISPKKSIEGALGGLAGSALAGIMISGLWKILQLNILEGMVLGLAVGFVSQVGDLTASAIKRYAGIKDFGRIIPGHGGILDRFDSIMFSLPFIFFYFIIFIKK